MFKARILVVDDEELLLELFVIKLRKLSHEVYKTSSSKEALEILKCTPIDVLVADFKMPDINGLTLIKSAIEIDPTIEGIILTGCLDAEIAESAVKIGVVCCFEKPVDFSELGNTIEKCMQKKQRLDSTQSRKTCLQKLNCAMQSI